jgi:teichoic acid transport system permease protein
VSKQAVDDDFTSEFHVYEPHRAGVPPIRPYARELRNRREFAVEMSRASMRAANTRTLFGQLWLVINPLLLALVYFILVNILSGGGRGKEFFAHLTAGLFAFYYVSACMSTGAGSVIDAGKLLLNTAFPRLLLPLSAVRTAFYRFLPTIPVYLAIALLAGLDWSPTMMLSVYFLACMTVFGIGMAAFFATLQVYFRDTASFLPYVLRIWLYLSPILYYTEDVPERFQTLSLYLNPFYSMMGGYGDALVRGMTPAPEMFLVSAVWALVALGLGSLFFMSRERDFAVRI